MNKVKLVMWELNLKNVKCRMINLKCKSCPPTVVSWHTNHTMKWSFTSPIGTTSIVAMDFSPWKIDL